LHGGTIEARSAGLGRGSQFVVRLPLASPSVERPTAAERPSAVSSHGRLRILVADDNVDAAESLAILLQMHGHDVERAYDGEVALDKLLSLQPDIALLDIGMPSLNG